VHMQGSSKSMRQAAPGCAQPLAVCCRAVLVGIPRHIPDTRAPQNVAQRLASPLQQGALTGCDSMDCNITAARAQRLSLCHVARTGTAAGTGVSGAC
jgi:hypothetical protein